MGEVRTPLRRLWSKRWVRRITYLLAGGAAVVQIGGWWLERPATSAWLVRKVDALVREETGAGIEVRRIRVGLWAGYLQLEDVSWGGDLLRIKRVDLQVDPWSLLSSHPHIHNLKLVEPHARLSEGRLAQLHFKSRPKTPEPNPQVRLDHLALEGAQIAVESPTYGIPALQLDFTARGLGQGLNAIRVDLASSHLQVQGPHGLERGKLELGVDLSEPLITLRHVAAKLGRTQIKAQGRMEPGRDSADLQVTSHVDLAQASAYLRLLPAPSGMLDVDARFGGPFSGPKWTLHARGKEVQPGVKSIASGTLEIQAHGERQTADLKTLTWSSAQGKLSVQGQWHGKEGLKGSLQGSDLDLSPLAVYLRAPQMGIPRFELHGDVALTGAPETWSRPMQWSALVSGRARDAKGSAGTFDVDLTQGVAQVDAQDLRLGDITANGQAMATLGPKGLLRLEAQGSADLRVSSVADALSAWKITDLPMDGTVHAEAKSVTWSLQEGLNLDGALQVQKPTWELETADDLTGTVKIRRDQLWVENILLNAGGGEATGNLWLTWGPVAKGAPQMESCYVAIRVPVQEGLRAAHLTDEDIGVVLRGKASGWARLTGPFQALRLTGGASVESGSITTISEPNASPAFHMRVPAAEGCMDFDLSTMRMRLTELHLAGAPEQLHGTPGTLDLRGQLDMDVERGQWWGSVRGLLDTKALDWPGPRISGRVAMGVQGPLTAPLGPINLPKGWIELENGGVEIDDISVGGFRGRVDFLSSALNLTLFHKEHADPLLKVTGRGDHGDLLAEARLRFLPSALDTAELSRRLSAGALEDIRLDLEAKGRWNGESDVRWQGKFNEIVGRFQAFTLGQTRKSEIWGDALGARLDLVLDGHQRGALSPEGAPLPGASVHLSGTLPFSSAHPMDLHAVGSMELSALKSVADALLDVEEGTLLKELRPEGLGSFDLTGRGTYLEPYVDGRLDMEGARLRIGELEDLRDLNMHLVFKDRTVSLPTDRPLTGTLNQGRVQASGEVRWQPGGLDRYAFRGRLDDFQIQDPPGLEGLLARGKAEATLTGDAKGGLLKGRITTDALSYQTDIKLTELLYQSALADTASANVSAPDDPLDAIRLDLDLTMNRPWEIDTNLAKLEGSPDGAFKILGTLAHQTLRGRMAIAPGGRITNLLPAGDVVLTRGAVDFSDPAVINPRLDLEGEVQVPGYTVTLGITGTLANLEWTLRSVPTLSKSDIVAVLINPDYASSVGSGPSTSSQTAVSSGAASAGTGLLTTLALAEFQDRLRKTLALDRFNVAVRSGTEGASETDVTLGKRFNLFGWWVPMVGSQKRRRDQTTTSLQVEWRFGGFTLQLGGSQTSNTPISPSGEIRTTWSPKP